jgi:predicted NAD/FAD-dependent oxidoreductase
MTEITLLRRKATTNQPSLYTISQLKSSPTQNTILSYPVLTGSLWSLVLALILDIFVLLWLNCNKCILTAQDTPYMWIDHPTPLPFAHLHGAHGTLQHITTLTTSYSQFTDHFLAFIHNYEVSCPFTGHTKLSISIPAHTDNTYIIPLSSNTAQAYINL